MKSIPIHQMFREAVLIPLFSIAFLSGTPYATAAQTSLSPKAELADGEYAIDLSMTGGSGKASVQSPALLTVADGTAYLSITWSSPNYDYMIVNEQKILNDSKEGTNSHFTIPVPDLTRELDVIADTLAMGTPHEVQYVLTFDPASIASKSTLPQEGAKRVLIMADVIIIGGGILNHFVNERRKQDYTGKRR